MPYTHEALDHYSGSYFDTELFSSELNQFLQSFVDLKVTEEIIIYPLEVQERKKFYEQTLVTKIAQVNIDFEGKIAEAEGVNDTNAVSKLQKEQSDQIKKLEEEYTKSDAEIEDMILAEKQSAQEEELKEVREKFQQYEKGIWYSITDQNGFVHSNVNGKTEQQVKNSSFYFKQFPYHTKSSDRLTDTNRLFITENLSGFIAIPNEQKAHSLIIEEMYDFQDDKRRFLINITIGILSLVGAAILTYRVRKYLFQQLKSIERIYIKLNIDIKLLLFGMTSFLLLVYIYVLNQDITDTIFLILVLTIWLGQIYVTYERRESFLNEWKNSWTLRQKEVLDRRLFNEPLFTIFVLLGISFITGTSIILFRYNHPVLYLLFAGFIGLVLLFYVLRKLAYFQVIMTALENLAQGIEEKDIKIRGKGPLAELAANINKVKEGVQFSQKAQAKSERLKTELISNVSHDLRTPLTSIINYTEFLKNKNISEEERENYIDIIDRKSQRLKVLIEDLFEVSKMASGDIELDLKKVDIVQLIKQALGEYDEKITKSHLEFRLSSTQTKIYSMVDGVKMWRVFDNIISNILKYSLDHSRVYIKTEETDNEITITFKNISKYDLKENIDELFERFKRGDDSRHTEGSGLGLAIAKSIVDHHGGHLDIELDGDLFKTIVTLYK